MAPGISPSIMTLAVGTRAPHGLASSPTLASGRLPQGHCLRAGRWGAVSASPQAGSPHPSPAPRPPQMRGTYSALSPNSLSAVPDTVGGGDSMAQGLPLCDRLGHMRRPPESGAGGLSQGAGRGGDRGKGAPTPGLLHFAPRSHLLIDGTIFNQPASTSVIFHSSHRYPTKTLHA